MAAVNLLDFASGDGVTDDFTGITSAITVARTERRTLLVGDPNVAFAHSGTTNWGWNYLKVLATGGNAKFKHTGTGVAHSFDGLANHSGQGAAGGVFGGHNRIFLEGNANTTDLVFVNYWHFGEMTISGRNATNSVIRGQDIVETTFDIHATHNSNGYTQSVVPNYGIRMVRPTACVFKKILIEFVGNTTYSTPGVSLVDAKRNLFLGGTVESCLAGGLSLNGGEFNTFMNMHNEVNGASNGDWSITANNNTFLNCHGAGTAAGQYLGGNNNIYTNCKFEKVLIPPEATKNKLENPMLIGTFTDQGIGTMLVNPTYS